MTQTVRVLKSDKEHEVALQRLAELMEQELVPGSDEEMELELLGGGSS